MIIRQVWTKRFKIEVNKIIGKVMLVIFGIMLMIPSYSSARADTTVEIKKLWRLDGWSILTSHKLGLLIARTNEQGITQEVDFININSGKSMWNKPDNDITKEYKNKPNHYFRLNSCFLITNNKIIIQDWGKSFAFSLFTGDKLWSISNLNLSSSVICQKENIIYTTYTKAYDTNTVDLVRFDLDKGIVLSSKKVNLASDDIALRSPVDVWILAVYKNLVFFNFGYQVQCFDLDKERVIWKTEPMFHLLETYIKDNCIFLSDLGQIDCFRDRFHYDCYNINTGKLMYWLNGGSLHIKDNRLFYFNYGCAESVSKEKNTYLVKDFYTLETINKLSYPDYYFSHGEYGTNYLAIAIGKDSFRTDNNSILNIYDYNLKQINKLTNILDGKNGYYDFTIQDDILLLNLFITDNPVQKSIVAYSLPDYKKSKHTYRLPAYTILKIIQHILTKVRFIR